jgi:hypothetical protein
VSGVSVAEYFTATSTTTPSTFAAGINLLSGCFSVGGICVSSPWIQDGSDLNYIAGKVIVGSTTATSSPGGVFRVSIDDSSSDFQAIKAVTQRSGPLNYGVNGTAWGTTTGANFGLYGWASGAAKNWGLYIHRGNSYMEEKLSIGTTTTNSWLTVHATSSGDSIISAYDSFGKSVFAVAANGNIGIGTSTPDEKLSIVSDGDADINVSTAGLDVGSMHFRRSRGTHDAPQFTNANDSVVNIEGEVWGGSGFSDIGRILMASEYNSSASGTPGYISFSTTPVDSTSVRERMRITSNGNIGIGTSSPFAKLSVVGDSYFAGNLTATGTLAIQGNSTSTFGGSINLTSGCFAVNGVCLANLSLSDVAYWDSLQNRWATSSSDSWLATKTTDNITQGSTNKYFSDTLARNALSSTATGLSYTPTTGALSLASGYMIPLSASTTEWSNKVSSQWTANGPHVYFNTGNVGIGTTSPFAKLSVLGDIISTQNGYFGGDITMTNTASHVGFVNTSQVMAFGGINSTGYNAVGAYMAMFGRNNNSSLVTPGGGAEFVIDSSVAPTKFNVTTWNGSGYPTLLTVLSSGNVGIGTTSPFAKLSVAGNTFIGGNLTATGTLTVSGTSTFLGPIIASSTATSTFVNSINLTSGCFAINGICIGGFSTTTNDSWLSSKTTDNLSEGSSKYFSDARARSAYSTSVTGLSYATSTGVLSLGSGYNIPLTASTTEWSSFNATPSSRITAGSNLAWVGNTLAVTGIAASQWTSNGSSIYYAGNGASNVGIGLTTPASLFSIGQTSNTASGGMMLQSAGVPGVGVWTPQTGSGSRQWYSITSSSDGTKLAAVGYYGQIYTSTDGGVNWTPRESVRQWRSITSSSDGTKLAAVAQGGQIYTSTDGGVNWTPRDSVRGWQAITSSSDGTKLVAAEYNGKVYTSTDSGVNWTPRDSVRSWISVTSSSDGVMLAAVEYNGQIYTSSDSGVNWTPRDSSRKWYSITSSSDGTKLAAVVNTGQIYTSINGGVNWTPRDSLRNWYSITSSSDGTKLAAVANTGQIYMSTDSGVSWTPQGTSANWYSIVSSSDGAKIAAGNDGGYVYTYATSYSYLTRSLYIDSSDYFHISSSGGDALFTSTGGLALGTTTSAKLSVAGDTYLGGNLAATGTLSITATSTFLGSLISSSTATSTFANSINLTSGCFSVGGTCLSSYSDTNARSAYSTTALGLTYATSTGVLSLMSGYNIPLTASTTEWANKVSSQWTSAGSNIYYNTGNVGIGTTTSNAKLAVVGDVYADTGSDSTRVVGISGFSTGKTGVFRFGDSYNQLDSTFGGSLNMRSYHGLTINNSFLSSEVARFGINLNSIDSYFNGNLGVGNVSPTSKLAVSKISGGYDTARFDRGNNRSAFVINNTPFGTTLSQNSYSDGSAWQRLDTGYDGWAMELLPQTGSGGTFSIYHVPSGANPAVFSQFFTIRGTGEVGIGSSTPSSKLTVTGNGYFGGNITATGTLAISGTGTSTFAGGINITSGCFAISGVCVGGGSGSQTPWTSDINAGGYALSNVGNITLASTSNRIISVGTQATGAGSNLTINAGSAGSSGSPFAGGNLALNGGNGAGAVANGGSIIITGGTASGGTPGTVTLSGGGGAGTMGAVNILGGIVSATGTSMSLASTQGNASLGATGGSLSLTTSAFSGVSGGAITLSTGDLGIGSSGYNINLFPGKGSTNLYGNVILVQNGGNVGIGSSTPSSKLTVTGNGYFGGNLTATGTLSILGTGTSTFAGGINLTSGCFAISGVCVGNVSDSQTPWTSNIWGAGYSLSSVGNITLASSSNRIITIGNPTSGGGYNLTVSAGSASASGPDAYAGGTLFLKGGDADSGGSGANGGAVVITGGTSAGNGAGGGSVTITSGTGTTGPGSSIALVDGDIALTAGIPVGGPGFGITILASDGSFGGNGGDVVVNPGAAETGGVVGNIVLASLRGNVGIGVVSPTATLQATGTIRFSGLGSGAVQTDANGNLTVSSDERLKDVKADFTRGMEDLMKIQPISYTWNAVSGYDTENVYSGFSAQNVQSAIPEAVSTSPNGYLALQDRPILAAVINSLKQIGNLFVSIENGVAHLKEVIVDKLHINGDVCVDDVCVTKEEFKNLLRSVKGTDISTAPEEDDGDLGVLPPVVEATSTIPIVPQATSTDPIDEGETDPDLEPEITPVEPPIEETMPPTLTEDTSEPDIESSEISSEESGAQEPQESQSEPAASVSEASVAQE